MAIDRILRMPEVKQVTGLSETTIYRKLAAQTFPAPVRLGPQSVGWKESQIVAWPDELAIAQKSPAPLKLLRQRHNAAA